MIAADGATRANLETAPSPVSSEDGNTLEDPSCKRPRVMHDELMPDAEPPVKLAVQTAAMMPDTVRSRVDLDELALCLKEEEMAEVAARHSEAANAAQAAAAAEPVAVEPICDGESFGMLDFTMIGSGPSMASTPPVDPPNKKLDLGLIARHLEASLPSVKRVAGRKVVLLLGNTGVGKSLLLQALAGRAVVRRRYSPSTGLAPEANADAMDTEPAALEEKWVWDVEEPLEGFGVGHEQASETKCIRDYSEGDDSIVYLDAPGCAPHSHRSLPIAALPRHSMMPFRLAECSAAAITGTRIRRAWRSTSRRRSRLRWSLSAAPSCALSCSSIATRLASTAAVRCDAWPPWSPHSCASSSRPRKG